MKKGAAITVISILAAAVIALGILFVTANGQKNQAVTDRDGMTEENIRLAADVAERDERIAALTGEAEAKTGEIETLTAEAAAKAGEVEALTAEAAAKAGEVETLKAEAAARAEEVEALKAETAAQDSMIQSLKEEAAGSKAAISEKEAKIGEQETLLKEQEALIAEKDKKIGEQETAIAEKDQKISEQETLISEQETLIAGKDTKIGELETAITDKDRKISELESTAAELQSKVDSQAVEIAVKDETIRSLNAQLENNPQTAGQQTTATAEPAGERMTYTAGGVTFRMPASIKHELGSNAEGQILFGDIPDMDKAPTVFLVMDIDVGVDVSAMSDAMMQVMVSTVEAEISKMDGVSNSRFEETMIQGHRAINVSFRFAINGKQAPAYGTILFVDQNALILMYASLEKTDLEVKAEMLQCIGSITLGDRPADDSTGLTENSGTVTPAALPDDRGLKFGMTRDEVKTLLGSWDETDDFHLGYSIVRYQNTPFRGRSGVFAVIFKDGGVHMWMNGVTEEALFAELEGELTAKFGASGKGPDSVIEVFLALDVTISESELESAIAGGVVDYRIWHVNAETDCVLMKVTGSDGVMTVYAFMQPMGK